MTFILLRKIRAGTRPALLSMAIRKPRIEFWEETMKNKFKLSTWRLAIATGVVFIFVASILSFTGIRAQVEERRLWDAEFVKKRQAAKQAPAATKPATKPATSPANQTPAKGLPAYRRVTPKNHTIDEKAEGEMVGVTVWRLRQSKAEDNKEARLLLLETEGSETKEWTPERVEAETIFSTGERVRLGIESPRDGFLYVIDREQYADGTTSEPYLIFPTLANRNGNNTVTAGKLIEIPNKSYFLLKPLRTDYAGESLTILITKEPIPDLKIGAGIIKLDAQLVEQWEKRWSVSIERFEMIGGAGKAYTKEEKESGDGSRLLTQADELPQTLYRAVAKTGDPILITMSLRIGK